MGSLNRLPINCAFTVYEPPNNTGSAIQTLERSLRSAGASTRGCDWGWGTDSGAPEPTYPKNLASSRISATLFRKCWKMEKIANISRKNILTYYNFWGTSPLIFRLRGTRPPVPPLSTPMMVSKIRCATVQTFTNHSFWSQVKLSLMLKADLVSDAQEVLQDLSNLISTHICITNESEFQMIRAKHIIRPIRFRFGDSEQ